MLWQLPNRTIDLTGRALVMGILNVTPDSFSDGGRYFDPRAAHRHALAMLEAGADILDIGGESTRPGAHLVDLAEERRRVIPAITEIRRAAPGALLSVDTSKSAIAREALAAGADIINDVTALRGDSAMPRVALEHRAGLILMHMQGNPRDMQSDPHYDDDVVAVVRRFFEERLAAAAADGIAPESIAFDPGIGFGKTLAHNLALLEGLPALAAGGRPLAIGLSRKSFIGKILESDDPGARLWPTVALTSFARERGVLIHRVHDVRECSQALRMTEAVLRGA